MVLSCEERYFTAHMLNLLVAPIRRAHSQGVKTQMQGPAAVAQLHCQWSMGRWTESLQDMATVLNTPAAMQRCGFTLVPSSDWGDLQACIPSLQS